MELQYAVAVRNELTSEVVTVRVCCTCAAEAQTEALLLLFKSQGWRKAVALVPEVQLSQAEPAA